MAELFDYKRLKREQWDTWRADGVFEGAPVALADGYIHLSTQAQTAETVTQHFAGQDDLILAMVDLAAVGDKVKWEVSRGGQLFPHLYGRSEERRVGQRVASTGRYWGRRCSINNNTTR